jgi:beta propeller repeat protein
LRPGRDPSARGAGSGGSGRLPGPVLVAVFLAGLLVLPAGAALTMEAVTGVFRVGEIVTIKGINTDNTTTFLFISGPYLEDRGVMLTNTSQPVGGGHFDTAGVDRAYSWTYEWNTSLTTVTMTDGIYILYASAAPVDRFGLAGRSYAQQNLYFQGRLHPVTTATTAPPTPVPTWTPPPAGVEVEASHAPTDDYAGRFDGDLIVYEARRADRDSDIYLYNISSGKTTAVATGPSIQKSPSISGGVVVYSAYELRQFNQSDADLYLYDVATGATTRLTRPGDQVNPRISGNLLAWQDEPPGRSSVNIMLSDLTNGVKQKVPARTWAYTPDLSGNRVIWVDDLTAPAVYLYDITADSARRVTNKTGIKGTPALDGNRITWADTRTDYAQVYVLDLISGVETQVTKEDSNTFTPVISGDRVAWVDFRNGNRDIYSYDLAARRETAIITAELQQISPQIGGCTVAWSDERNGSYDVYYKKIPGCTPPPAPAHVSLQPEETPTTVTTVPLPTTTRVTTVTTLAPPSTPPPTTKPPGFGALPALVAAGAAVLFLVRVRSR